jgi:hypothetical protein
MSSKLAHKWLGIETANCAHRGWRIVSISRFEQSFRNGYTSAIHSTAITGTVSPTFYRPFKQ